MSKAPVKSTEADATIPTNREDVVGKRIEAMRAKRQQRGELNDSGFNQKLSIPESLKDKRLNYRWVTDRATRKMEMEAKGYEVVSSDMLAGDDRNSGMGSVIERVVNERTTPGVEKGFLMAKPKEFYEEDKAKEQARIKELEDGIKRGDVRDPQGLSGPTSYVPAGGIKIGNGR